MDNEQLIAGIVLGSNSFHLVTARLRDGRLTGEAHLQEAVQLAMGMTADGKIEPAYVERARTCFESFASELAKAPPDRVAAVATGVLREAANAAAVLDTAARVLGMPVHVLSGRDEALLTFAGVALTFDTFDDNRLVVDIGGGSTELIVGRGFAVQGVESAVIGSAAVMRRYFVGERVTADDLTAAESGIADALQPAAASLGRYGWAEAVGTGGTVLAAGRIMQMARMCGSAISRKGLERFKAAIREGRLAELGEGIATPERLAMLPGGVALLCAIFDVFGLERIKMSPGALREGVLVMVARGQLPGRVRSDDSAENAS